MNKKCTELEQKFYDTFGIGPEHNDGCKLADNYWNNENLRNQYKTFDEYLNINCTEGDSGLCYSDCDFAYDDLNYTEITSDRLLEMICIYSKYTIFCLPINAGDFEEKWTYEKLKNHILKELICFYKANIYNTNQKLQSEIQQLFKEG